MNGTGSFSSPVFLSDIGIADRTCDFLFIFFVRGVQFRQKIIQRFGLALAIFSIPLCDLFLHLGVLEFQPVFQIIYIDNAGNGNAVFFQNETLLVEVRPACDLSQIDAGFG